MSSLKHSIHRRVHLERATPANRLRFGILERRQDYKLRANRYHEKERLFQALREKARTRNPDEFHFNMINSKLNKGRYEKIEKFNINESLSKEEKKLMSSQNLSYIKYRKSIDDKKIEKMESELQIIGYSTERKHLFFNDDENEVNSNCNDTIDKNLTKEIVKTITKSYKMLNDTIIRSSKLERIEGKLELQKNLLEKGRRRKIIDNNGKVNFVWYPKRKK
ncbi:putative U3 small nucleolar RNA-associated protein 11 [Cryptosporidium serpentis]